MVIMTRLRNLWVLIAAAVLLAGCSGANWGWYVISPETEAGRRNLLFLLGGLKGTIALSVLSFVIAVILGLLIALPALYGNRPLRAVNRLYVEPFRAAPALVLILWVYYGLPVVLGIRLEAFSAGVVALALSESAFLAEIFRAGIQSVGRGQDEAADAIGLTFADKMWFVILPQAIRRILPPLGNQFVYMLKMSSLVSVIGLGDLTRRANELVVNQYRPLEIYTFLVLEYLVLIMIVSHLVRRLENRMRADERQAR
jgi:polar amino acid transport system permease protein